MYAYTYVYTYAHIMVYLYIKHHSANDRKVWGARDQGDWIHWVPLGINWSYIELFGFTNIQSVVSPWEDGREAQAAGILIYKLGSCLHLYVL